MNLISKLTELFLIAGVFQGLFLIITLWRLKSGNPTVNSTLRSLLTVLYLMLSGRYLLSSIEADWIYQWAFLPDVAIYLFGPLLYTYIRAISSIFPVKLLWYHYIPAFGQFLIFIYVIQFTPEGFHALMVQGTLNTLFFWDELLAIISSLVYVGFSFYTIKRSIRDGNARNQALIFGRFVLICCTIILISWLCSFSLKNIFPNYNQYGGYDTIWFLIPLFFFYISFYAIKHPKLFEIKITKQKNGGRINKNSLKLINESLKEIENNEKFYLNPQITLQELSKLVNVNTNDLSWYLNNELNKTFYEYINELRVQEFLKLLENGEHQKQTLLSLAYASGFNSKSTFNKSFKSIKGTTPTNFLKELKR